MVAVAPEPPAATRSEDPELLALIGDDLPALTLQSGEVLFAEGDPAGCMYVVTAGMLRIRSGSVVYEDVGPGGIVGEMALIEKHCGRSATVYALGDCELAEIDDARFAALIVEHPDFAITVMRVLSRRLRVMDQRYGPPRWT